MARVAGTLATLLRHVVDYAGLFPPAQLPLAEAARLYSEYRRGPHAWMLGAFVCPAAKLAELAACVPEGEVWPVSVLAQEPFELPERLACEWAEAKAASEQEIRRLRSWFPRLYVETGRDELLLAVLHDCGARAKIRMGGESVPDSRFTARFLEAVVRHELPFKATAGLHHPFRTDSMHGFLNVLVASTLARRTGIPLQVIEDALDDGVPESFHFGSSEIRWRDRRIPLEEIEATRAVGFISFGSCSFDEPVQDLEALGLL